MKNKRVLIGSDHAGFELKETLISVLQEWGYEVVDEGTYSEERTDYPDYAHKVAIGIEEKKAELGVLICGSANGVSMAANRHDGIRSAIAWTPKIAEMARTHNDANILSLPARFISEEEAKNILRTFLNNDFEGGRHANRVKKIDVI